MQVIESVFLQYHGFKKKALQENDGQLFPTSEDTLEQRMIRKVSDINTLFKSWKKGGNKICQGPQKTGEGNTKG